MNKVYSELFDIQTKLVAKKDQYNKFGNYPYRTAEGILAEIKPLLKECVVLVDEKIELIGDRYYVVATATITDGETFVRATSQAREDLELKGMTSGQLSGATSSYAKKYALSNLFAIDGTEKDLDGLNDEKPVSKNASTPSQENNPAKQEKPQQSQINQAQINVMQISEFCSKTNGYFTYENIEKLIKSKFNLTIESLTPNQLRAVLGTLEANYESHKIQR